MQKPTQAAGITSDASTGVRVAAVAQIDTSLQEPLFRVHEVEHFAHLSWPVWPTRLTSSVARRIRGIAAAVAGRGALRSIAAQSEAADEGRARLGASCSAAGTGPAWW